MTGQKYSVSTQELREGDLLNKTSKLTIIKASNELAGIYECRATVGNNHDSSKFELLEITGKKLSAYFITHILNYLSNKHFISRVY